MIVFLSIFVALCFIMLVLSGLSIGTAWIVIYYIPKITFGESMIFSLILLVVSMKAIHAITYNMKLAKIGEFDWEEENSSQMNHAKNRKKRMK